MNTLKSFLILAFCFALFSCQPGEKKEDHPWSVRMVESEIARNPESWMLDFANKRLIWSYCAGLELEAIIKTGEQYNIPAFFDYAYQFADTVINEQGDIIVYRKESYNIDFINPGKFVLDVWEKTGEERFKKAAFNLRDQLYTHPRTTEGGFWHKQVYPHQMWLDGLYMGSPFYARFCATFDQPEYFPDIIKQFQLVAKYTYDPATGLFRHGWDEARQQKWADPVTGQSANVWGRAMGWFGMALVDALDWIPVEQRGRDSMITILKTVAEGIKKYRDKESGLWFQVIDKGSEPGNYLEATCSSMFIYTLEKASRKGYIDAGYAAIARDAYNSFIKTFIKENEDGTISITNCCEVAGLGGNDRRDGTYGYYISEPVRDNDPKAVGPFILVSLQFEKKN
ncbi:MAG: glycoside hydrolase family 88 protein [Tannerella sp.]|nr:glycoside hydrolase family 88 protein [Tannerella sp.]